MYRQWKINVYHSNSKTHRFYETVIGAGTVGTAAPQQNYWGNK